MRLIPTVVLVSDVDLATLEPLLMSTQARLQATPLEPATSARMRENGWTLDMLAWSIVIASFARAVADGHFEVVHVTDTTPVEDRSTPM